MAVSTKKWIDYHAHIEAWIQSGLSKIKYCENANISYRRWTKDRAVKCKLLTSS